METLMIIGLFVVCWVALGVVTWSLCVVAARGDAALAREREASRDRTDRFAPTALRVPADAARQRRMPAA